jgi:hypothetical protein
MIDDAQRLQLIARLISEGRQLVLAQDTAAKSRLVRYGGCGYAHILHNIIPRMRFRGFKGEDIQAMLGETPRRILAFAAPAGRAGDRGRCATPGHRDRSGRPLGFLDGAPDALRCRRHVELTDPEGSECVHDGVHHGRKRPDGPRLPCSLGAEGIQLGGHGVAPDDHLGKHIGARQRVFHE